MFSVVWTTVTSVALYKGFADDEFWFQLATECVDYICELVFVVILLQFSTVMEVYRLKLSSYRTAIGLEEGDLNVAVDNHATLMRLAKIVDKVSNVMIVEQLYIPQK